MESFTAKAAAKRMATTPTHVVQRAPMRCSRFGVDAEAGVTTGVGPGAIGGDTGGAIVPWGRGATGVQTRARTGAGSMKAGAGSGAGIGSGGAVGAGGGATGAPRAAC